MIEVWKDIKDYEGLYQVSNLGRIKSLERKEKCSYYYRIHKERILKPRLKSNGYVIVCLCKNGKNLNKHIHRLAAEAFIPNPNNLPQVNHKDENKLNNCVENLEWCDRIYNNNYGTKNKRMLLNRKGKTAPKPVKQYNYNNVLIKEWSSAQDINRKLNFDSRNICKCCNGKRKTAYGYIWRYC